MGRRYSYSVKLLYCYIAILLYCLLTPSSVFAQVPVPWSEPRCVRTETINGQVIEVATIQGFECLFVNIVRVLVPIAGLAMFIMLIVGSFQMITAGGEVKQIQKARKTLTSAIFGLVAFLGIWFILLFIKTITGVDVTQFIIPGP